MHVGVGGWILQVRDEALDLRGDAGLEVEDLAAAQLALLEDGQLDAGDDAEVVRAASERNPQVLVDLRVGVDDLAAGKNNLVVDYVVTDEATSIRVVREPTLTQNIGVSTGDSLRDATDRRNNSP